MTVGLRADFSGAIRKTAILKEMPKAHKWVATNWTAETIKELMRSAAGMQKSGKGRKTSMMGRNVGFLVAAGDDRWQIAIGTGVGGKQTVPYARIQDQGGTTRAHIIYAKPGGVLAFPWKGKDMFLSHVHHPGSHIPASGWFSNVIAEREPILSARMSKAEVLKIAEMRAGSSAGKLA